MNQNHYRFNKSLEIARALFTKDWPQRCFHVSIIFNKNRIVAIGQNSKKSHPLNLKNLPASKIGDSVYLNKKSTCSELAAFQILKNKTNIPTENCVLVNVRINRNNQIANSHPCATCCNLIIYLNFKEVWFTNHEGNFQAYNQI